MFEHESHFLVSMRRSSERRGEFSGPKSADNASTLVQPRRRSPPCRAGPSSKPLLRRRALSLLSSLFRGIKVTRRRRLDTPPPPSLARRGSLTRPPRSPSRKAKQGAAVGAAAPSPCPSAPSSKIPKNKCTGTEREREERLAALGAALVGRRSSPLGGARWGGWGGEEIRRGREGDKLARAKEKKSASSFLLIF